MKQQVLIRLKPTREKAPEIIARFWFKQLKKLTTKKER